MLNIYTQLSDVEAWSDPAATDKALLSSIHFTPTSAGVAEGTAGWAEQAGHARAPLINLTKAKYTKICGGGVAAAGHILAP